MEDCRPVKYNSEKQRKAVVEIVRYLNGFEYAKAVAILNMAQREIQMLTYVHSESFEG